MFGGLSNSVVQFTTQSAEYQWERYQVNTTYKWGRYSTRTQSINIYGWTQSKVYSPRYIIYPGTKVSISLAEKFSDNKNSERNSALNLVSDSATGPSATVEMLNKYIGYYFTDTSTSTDNTTFYGLTVSDVSALSSRSSRCKLTYVGTGQGTADGISITYQFASWTLVSTTQETVRGSYIDDVSSTSSSAYPSNGASGSYWYVSNGSETSRGNYIDIVSSTDYNAYSNDGIQSGYWYIRKN